MKKNNLKTLFLSTFLLALLFTLPPAGLAKNHKAGDADLIDMSAAFRGDVLRLRFTYRNRKIGRRIQWDRGRVDCSCQVFGLAGKDGGAGSPPVLTTMRRFLTHSRQEIYLDIPEADSRKYAAGLVRCDLAAGWESYRVEDVFRF